MPVEKFNVTNAFEQSHYAKKSLRGEMSSEENSENSSLLISS